ATAGSLFHLPVVRNVELGPAVDELRARGLQIVGASALGEVSMYEADLTRPTAMLFGNEAHGLSPEALSLTDVTVRAPIVGAAESLNLAAATALLLFESTRQRMAGPSLASLVSGAAHDIRSPLASMVGFTHTMLSRWESLDDEQKLAMVGTVAFDAGRLRTLVAQLVDAARLTSGGVDLDLQPTDLLEVARKVSSELSHPELPPVEVVGDGAMVSADPKRVVTILAALIEACRWWGEIGSVRVRVHRGAGPTVEISREGTRGLPAADLFAPREPGSGGGGKVALFVAKGLADAHGASLEAVANGGITFRLGFPSP
ncbi:MAG TPA: TrmH family RNA methyltransferase, partial [Actinomycetota bacterium]|nr:TrmH family RNA methyltransferase [Actinomycetota bacterium]